MKVVRSSALATGLLAVAIPGLVLGAGIKTPRHAVAQEKPKAHSAQQALRGGGGTPVPGGFILDGTRLSLYVNSNGSFFFDDGAGRIGEASLDGVDFFLPGTPYNAFLVSVDGSDYQNWGQAGNQGIPGTATNTSAGSTLSFHFEGDTPELVHLSRDVSFDASGTIATVTVTLTNNNEVPAANVRFQEAADPDQGDYTPASTTDTFNDVFTASPTGTPETFVVATLDPFQDGFAYTVGLVTADEPVVAGFSGNWPFFTSAGFTSGAFDPNGGLADDAMALDFDLGTLEPGQSITRTFQYRFGATYREALGIDPTGSSQFLACTNDGDLFYVDVPSGRTHPLPHSPGPGTEVEVDLDSGYGFLQAPNGDYGGWVINPETGEALTDFIDDGASFTGLEWIDGLLFGTAIDGPDGPSVLVVLDPFTGSSEFIGETGVGPIAGLAWDANNEVLYGISGGSEAGVLLTLDLGTGEAFPIDFTGEQFGSIEFDQAGTLWGIVAGGPPDNQGGRGFNAYGGDLFTIDTETAAINYVASTGYWGSTGLALATGLTPAPLPPTRFLAATHNNQLYTIDLPANSTSLVNPEFVFSTEIEVNPADGRGFSHEPGEGLGGSGFDPATGNTTTDFIPTGAAFTGLEWIDGTLYGTAMQCQDCASSLYTLDPDTGETVELGPTGYGPIAGLAWDPNRETLFGITGGSSSGYLVGVNFDGSAFEIGYTGHEFGSIEVGSDGFLYGLETYGPGGDRGGSTAGLFRINPSSAFSSFVMYVPYVANTGLALLQGSCAPQWLDCPSTPTPVRGGRAPAISVENEPNLCGAHVTWEPPTLDTETCTEPLQEGFPTSNYNPGDLFPVGITTVTYTAMTVSGQVSTCSFDVEVRDTQVPILYCPPADWTVHCNAPFGFIYYPDYLENCPEPTFLTTPFNGYPFGTTPGVMATLIDQSGNESNTCTFDLHVIGDVQDPLRPKSNPRWDGTVTESKAGTGVGGSSTSVMTGILIGDDSKNRQLKAVVSFDLSNTPIPADAFITRAFVRMTRVGLAGHPENLGPLTADFSPTFGSSPTLTPDDFEATTDVTPDMVSFPWAIADKACSIGEIDSSYFPRLNRTGLNQFRFHYATPWAGWGTQDSLIFASGEAANSPLVRPEMVIEYFLASCNPCNLPGAGGPVAATATCASIPAQDGYLKEAHWTSGVGNFGLSTGSNFLVGDSADREQLIGLLSFDTSSIPPDALIDSATLNLRRIGATGAFDQMGSLVVDMRCGGIYGSSPTLETTDFEAFSHFPAVATLPVPIRNNQWTSAPLTEEGADAIQKGPGAITQMKIRFTNADNANAIADYLIFGTSDGTTGNQPTLVINYHTAGQGPRPIKVSVKSTSRD